MYSLILNTRPSKYTTGTQFHSFLNEFEYYRLDISLL